MYPTYTTTFLSLLLLILIFYLFIALSGVFHKNCGTVLSVSKSRTHTFSKTPLQSITLLRNLGIKGDAHLGTKVQHLSRRKVAIIPPNLRQVHIIHSELFSELKVQDEEGKSHEVKPGELGENITTRGIDVLGLSVGTRLVFVNEGEDYGEGKGAVVRITGLRNPCPQIERFQEGLLGRCVVKENGRVVERKAGIMGVVERGGEVRVGARILVKEPWFWKRRKMNVV